MSDTDRPLTQAKRWVIKLGSALLTADGQGVDVAAIQTWAAQMAALRAAGKEVVLVTSGSVAVGMQRMAWQQRPHALHDLQAMAAIGQMGLVQIYESAFQAHGLHTAQVLLSHADLSDRRRYLNARSTLRTLLGLGVIPVINENDTVATEEIRFGDNDTLAALVVNLVEADVLVLLTDQDGLFDKDPEHHDDAQLITQGNAGDPALLVHAGSHSGPHGRGGMRTKLLAAQKAARSGACTVIAHGHTPQVLQQLAAGGVLGTCLLPAQGRVAARKQWLAGQTRVSGRLRLDPGAVRVLREQGKSLLPVGVTAVEGEFVRGEVVACVDAEGTEIARGLVNYNAAETTRILGQASQAIEGILGYVDEPELIHRDNMVIV